MKIVQGIWRSTKLVSFAKRVGNLLKDPRFSSSMAFFALVVAVLSYVFPRSGQLPQGRPVFAPPAGSVCAYDLNWDRTQAYDAGFAADDSFVQPIDAQLAGLKSVITVGPVIDFDAREVDLTHLAGVTIGLQENGKLIESDNLSIPAMKTVPAPFFFKKEVPIDHSKRYAIVVKNTTSQNITIWINKTGPLKGYQRALRNGVELDGSMSGQVCGFK